MRNRKWISVLLAFVLTFQLVALTACAETQTGDTSADNTISNSVDPNSGSSGKETPTTDPLYRMNFATGDGASQTETIVAKEGDPISAPATPQMARHTFAGWYTDYGTFNNEYVFGTMPGANVTLYAKWIAAASDDEVADYEAQLSTTSQEGHMYVHYLRFNNDPDEYEPLNLWVWPEYETGRTFDWNRDSNGKIIVDEIAGATCDIDLTKKYTDAGKDEKTEMQFLWTAGAYKAGDIKNSENYVDQRLGFLVVYKDSKGIAGQHWRSDGNANQYLEITEALWDNGSIHVFCVQDNIADFVYHLSEQGEIVNPYDNDDGTHVSTSNVNSSEVLKVEHGTNLTDTVSGVGYQIMVSSFADSNGDGMGDIRGIIDNLEYIEKLNVDVLWLTPIQLSDSYHGYDIIDYKAVDPKFGTLDDYKELLEKCHAKGIKVIMDLVLNHTSTNNVWFQKSVKMIEEDGIDYRNFYQWRNHTKEKLSEAWYPYSEYDYSYYAKFSPSMPELNYDNKDTRDAIVDVAKYWLGILGEGNGGVDGFRIDAVKHIYMADESYQNAGDIIINDYDDATQTDYSSNLTKNINFFTYFANEIKAKYPNCYLVGENFDGHAFNVAPYYTAFDGMLDFYMYYNFGEVATYPTAAASLAGANSSSGGSLPTGKNTDRLKSGSWNFASILATQAAYSQYGLVGSDNGTNSTIMGSLFSSNHDIPRLMNNVVRNYSGGSWTAGTVTASNKAQAELESKAVISAMMTLPGISWVYYGDEIGMSSNYADGEDENSPHADRASRQPFKWTTAGLDNGGSKYTTNFSISGDTTLYVVWDSYNKTVAGVKEQDADQNSFLNSVRYWTEKKSTDEVLRYGSYEFIHAWGEQAAQLLSFKRSYNGKTYWCLTNFGTNNANVGSMVAKGSVKYANGYANGSLAGGSTMVIELSQAV